MNKYKNKNETVDGEHFDSIKEANRWRQLKLMEKAGLITDLKRQVKHELIPAQYIDGKCVERSVTYTSDFEYVTEVPVNKRSVMCSPIRTVRVVEDVKGVRTKDYVIKRKLMLYIHGIKITEI